MFPINEERKRKMRKIKRLAMIKKATDLLIAAAYSSQALAKMDEAEKKLEKSVEENRE